MLTSPHSGHRSPEPGTPSPPAAGAARPRTPAVSASPRRASLRPVPQQPHAAARTPPCDPVARLLQRGRFRAGLLAGLAAGPAAQRPVLRLLRIRLSDDGGFTTSRVLRQAALQVRDLRGQRRDLRVPHRQLRCGQLIPSAAACRSRRHRLQLRYPRTQQATSMATQAAYRTRRTLPTATASTRHTATHKTPNQAHRPTPPAPPRSRTPATQAE